MSVLQCLTWCGGLHEDYQRTINESPCIDNCRMEIYAIFELLSLPLLHLWPLTQGFGKDDFRHELQISRAKRYDRCRVLCRCCCLACRKFKHRNWCTIVRGLALHKSCTCGRVRWQKARAQAKILQFSLNIWNSIVILVLSNLIPLRLWREACSYFSIP